MIEKPTNPVFLLVALVLACQSGQSSAQDVLYGMSEEDLQEILAAIQESDLPAELNPLSDRPEISVGSRKLQGWWDGRVALSSVGKIDRLTRLKIKSKYFLARGRVRKAYDGTSLAAGTAVLFLGPLEIHAGGIGMNAGYGLLVQRPGRSAGLAAGQSFRGISSRIVGWATLPEKKSVWGLGGKLKGRGWNLSAMHGLSGDEKSEAALSALHLTRDLGPLMLGMGTVHILGQRGFTLSGSWQKEKTNLGFEWIAWKNQEERQYHGAWLVSLQTRLPLGVDLQARWAASNSNVGPFAGGRPAVLSAWGGAGWAVRLRGRLSDNWRLQMLWSESIGPDWTGLHRRHQKRFADLLLLGRFPLGWEIKARWHERIRMLEGWSEDFPWLPPSQVGEDERVGLALDLKRELVAGTWIFTLRSLGRMGGSTVGRRTLGGVRFRGRVFTEVSYLFSYQWAWGDAIDLVSAVNPLRGLVLPRHWGNWASEIILGLEYSTGLGRIMMAFSRREPALGGMGKGENRLWAGFQARLE